MKTFDPIGLVLVMLGFAVGLLAARNSPKPLPTAAVTRQHCECGPACRCDKENCDCHSPTQTALVFQPTQEF